METDFVAGERPSPIPAPNAYFPGIACPRPEPGAGNQSAEAVSRTQPVFPAPPSFPRKRESRPPAHTSHFQTHFLVEVKQ